jgi:hypothetical protein
VSSDKSLWLDNHQCLTQLNSLERRVRVIRIGESGRRDFASRSWSMANCLRRKRFSAASAFGGRRASQKNVARSPSSVIAVF